jgi:hypothetical protein
MSNNTSFFTTDNISVVKTKTNLNFVASEDLSPARFKLRNPDVETLLELSPEESR